MKRFVVAWIAFWSIVIVFTFLYWPRPDVGEHEVVCVGMNQRAWTIAQELFPGEDPRRVVAQIEVLNPGIDFGNLQPGELIKIPKNIKRSVSL